MAQNVDTSLRMESFATIAASLNDSISFTREGYLDVDASVPANAMTDLAIELDIYMSTHWVARASYAITHGKEWVATGIAIGAYTVVPSSVEAYVSGAVGSVAPNAVATRR